MDASTCKSGKKSIWQFFVIQLVHHIKYKIPGQSKAPGNGTCLLFDKGLTIKKSGPDKPGRSMLILKTIFNGNQLASSLFNKYHFS